MRNVLLLIIVILTSGCSVTEKPNIIWITVEDQSAYFFPFYGLGWRPDIALRPMTINDTVDRSFI